MSRREADARFLLPNLPRQVMGVGGGVAPFLQAASRCATGITTDPTLADTIVCRADALEEALEHRVPQVLVLDPIGPRAARRPRRDGYEVRRYHAWGTDDRVRFYIPADDRGAGRLVLRGRRATSPAGRARNVLLRSLVELGVPLPRRGITVCSYDEPVPAIVRAAGAITGGVTGTYLDAGSGDDLQRLVAYLADGSGPRAVCKFTRVPGNALPFDHDLAAAALVQELGDLAAHAPALLARSTLDGVDYLVETHAAGSALSQWLDHDPPPWSRPLVERITTWIEGVHHRSADSARPAGSGSLRLDLAPEELHEPLRAVADRVPGVIAHHDLGSWNILVTPTDFTVVDWEGAARPALPLWDLWYFLADTEARFAATTTEARVGAIVDLFAGRTNRSAALFATTRRLARSLHIDDADVGPLLLGCWLTHGARRDQRTRAIAELGAPSFALDHLSVLWSSWLADPALGLSWSAFLASR